jgi:hypothetical protein
MITDYEHFDIEDFASNDSFKNWVLHPSPKSNFFGRIIYKIIRTKHTRLNWHEISFWVFAVRHIKCLQEATVSRLWSTINEHIENEETLESQNFWHHWSLSKIGSSVAILLCLGAVFFNILISYSIHYAILLVITR